MSPWITLIIGLAIGWFIGMLLVHQNHETCRQQVEHLRLDLQEQEAQLRTAREDIAQLKEAV